MNSALCVGILSASTAQTKWEPLFNGKNLKGWTTKDGKAEYVVRDGAVVGIARDKTPNSFLCTSKTYGDFILEMEVFMDTPLNSGIQFRSQTRPDETVGVQSV